MADNRNFKTVSCACGSSVPVSGPLISAREICKSYNTVGSHIEVLKNVSFDLKSGETVAIVGASGIGKSTLLQILGVLDRPDSGELLFKGQNVLRFSDVQLAKFRNECVGFVFQFHHLLPEFSALENVMMPILIRGESKLRAREAAEAVLARVGLESRKFHRIGELSGGEQQRVALARALVLKPDLLLADEPTGNLDKKNSQQVHGLLMDLNREYGMTMVVVTHNLELASYMSRRVTIVDGQLVEAD